MRILVLTLFGVLSMVQTFAQNKKLTMEDAILGHHLRPVTKYYAWQGNRDRYTFTDQNDLIGVEAKNGKKHTILTLNELNELMKSDLKGFPHFQWVSDDVIALDHKHHYYEVNVQQKQIVRSLPIAKRSQNRTYGNGLFAYTIDNNLYYQDRDGKQIAITTDNNKNIINGQTVSRSEFGIHGGIFWSNDGKKIAFYRKDETAVRTFPLLDITSRTGTLNELKYPMAGMDSENIALCVYDLDSGKTITLNVDDFDAERYLTNITWSPDNKTIFIQVLNRAQNHMRLNQYDAGSGQKIKTFFEEQSDTYVEPQNPLYFVGKDGGQFVYRTNNRDNYFNLYLYDMDGKLIRNLTPVKADVDFVGEDGKYVYYSSAEISPVENHLFKTPLKGGKATCLTNESGWHNFKMSATKLYFIDEYSSVTVPRVIALKNTSGKKLRELLKADDPSKDYQFGTITLGDLKGVDGVTDHYYRLIKPIDFDASQKYPVIVYVYGGPHSQMVKNSWQAQLRMWEMYMAQQGYVVFVMDNRGTSNRGKSYESAIHGQCGQKEMEDQMQGIKFLQSQPWVDMNRIGVHGWSYGGFMTISLITNYPEIFKVAVAGGPVIDWKWYEVMYGERYMGSPKVNASGYEKVSLMHKAKDLKGKLLICQGAIDDVVLWQHSLSFVRECVKNNVQVDYFPYPCAQHNVLGKDRVHLMQKVTNYFEDYLK